MSVASRSMVGGVVKPLLGGTYDNTTSEVPQNYGFVVKQSGTIENVNVPGADNPTETHRWDRSFNAVAGNTYWVRFTRTAGSSTGYAGATEGAWHALSSDRYCVYDSLYVLSSSSGTYTVEIALDSGGSHIVTSGTYVAGTIQYA